MDEERSSLITFHGCVETTLHALRIIHAAHKGLIPRVARRLTDNERHCYIKSGSVFVFSVQESGIKRWTDGLYWTPSRIVDNFLIYKELKEKGPVRSRSQRSSSQSSPFTTGVSRDYNQRINDQPAIKPGGLVKKTISVTIEKIELHLVAYYTVEDLTAGKLKKPTSVPQIMKSYMSPKLFCIPSFRVPPNVVTGKDGASRLAGDIPDEGAGPDVKSEPSETGLYIPHSPTSSPVDSYTGAYTTSPSMVHSSSYANYSARSFSLPWPSNVQGQNEILWDDEDSVYSNAQWPHVTKNSTEEMEGDNLKMGYGAHSPSFGGQGGTRKGSPGIFIDTSVSSSPSSVSWQGHVSASTLPNRRTWPSSPLSRSPQDSQPSPPSSDESSSEYHSSNSPYSPYSTSPPPDMTGYGDRHFRPEGGQMSMFGGQIHHAGLWRESAQTG